MAYVYSIMDALIPRRPLTRVREPEHSVEAKAAQNEEILHHALKNLLNKEQTLTNRIAVRKLVREWSRLIYLDY